MFARSLTRCWRYTTYGRFFSSLPRHTKLTMPALSPTMKQGGILSWNKKEGDALIPGDILCDIETDKATVGYEIQEDGFLAKQVIPAGAKDVPVGDLMAIVVDDKKNVGAFKDFKADSKSPAKSSSDAKAESPKPAASSAKSESTQKEQPKADVHHSSISSGAKGEPKASVIAQHLAKEHNVPLDKVKGRGPRGLIMKADVLEYALFNAGDKSYASSQAKSQEVASKTQESGAKPQNVPSKATPAGKKKVTPSPFEEHGLETAAAHPEKWVEAKTQLPHFYLNVDIKMDELLKVSAKLSGKSSGVIDLIIKAAALACQDIPEVRSKFTGKALRRFNDVNVHLTTGRIEAVIENAIHKRIGEIAKARQEKQTGDSGVETNFAIVDLREYGVKAAEEIVDPNHSCVLTLSAITKEWVPTSDPATPMKVTSTMRVALSCDHRAVDGAVGAEWLTKFRSYMENPSAMLF